MDGGAIAAIAASVGPMVLVVIGASYHLGSKIGQFSAKLDNIERRLGKIEDNINSEREKE